MSNRHVNYGLWAFRVIAWDTMLPVCVLLIAYGLELFFPNRRGVLEIAAVLLPVTAFLFRIRIGKRHIASNQCSKAVRRFQFGVFAFGILPLVMIDCLIVLSGLMPKGALFASPKDIMILIALASVYLVSMIIAMYPGRQAPSPDAFDDFTPFRPDKAVDPFGENL